jgi:hypothetical protein
MPRVYTSRLKRLGLVEAMREIYEACVIRCGPDECWGWNGATLPGGYGQINVWGDRPRQAHIYAYEQAKGPVPPGLDVMHTCHNPPCSNSAHLEPGTRSQNQRMSRAAGRWPTKIPFEDLDYILERRRAGDTLEAIGKRYGCTKQAVRSFLRTWGA